MGKKLRQSEYTNKELYDEEYLKIIVNSSLDGITVVDEEGKFEFANESFFRIIEWPEEEIIGNYFMKIIPEDMKEFVLHQWNNVQEGIPNYFETRIKTKNGQIKYVSVAHKITEINREKKVVSVTKDITENKKLEEELRKYRDHLEELVKERTAELEEKNANLETFNRAFVGRELRMVELKNIIAKYEKRISELEKEFVYSKK